MRVPAVSTSSLPAVRHRSGTGSGKRLAALLALTLGSAGAAFVLVRRLGITPPWASTKQPPAYETPAAREAGAPGAATAAAEEAAEQAGTPDGATLHTDDLPIEDYDHLTVGSLQSRIRSLSVEELTVVRAYEAAHAHRLQVTTMLDNRIAKLRAEAAPGPDAGTGAGTGTEAAAAGSAAPNA
ncbi:hypothetical protein [Motilibacter deserti]|uniref:DUF8129 domain-containing protein n=1 Tax=Motilibacter deserti TaxID=2714956 RepID=A0ABX0H239_9ACTN|nr:hypothetical protein [Motilibacter deserti]NHC15498.1 hypothetical protein [Motilibacter deserti]